MDFSEKSTDPSKTTDGCDNNDVPEASSGASESSGNDGISDIDRLLLNHRRDIMFELRRLQHGIRPVTGQGNKEAVENFFARAQNETGKSPDQGEHRPENVMVEVSDLVDRRPVSSLLASFQFRSNLESALRGALSSMQLRRPFPSRTNIGEEGASGRVRSAVSEHVGLAARNRPRRVPPPVDFGTWRPGHTRREPRRNPPTVTWAEALNDTETPSGDSALPDQSDDSGSGGALPLDAVTDEQASFLSSAALTFHPSESSASDSSASNSNASQMQLTIQAALVQARRDELVADISELVQRELVSSTLTGTFRGSLERLMTNHLHNTHTDGQRVAQFVRSLPGRRPPRNDFSHLGIGTEDWRSDDLDELSVISATAAAAAVHHAQINPALSRELAAIRSQLQEMNGLIQMIFETQLDTQRAIRQEVAAAMNKALSGSEEASGSPIPVAATPFTNGKCAVCLDQDADALLYQCGHMCVCYGCGIRLKQGGALCPLCRAPIRDIVRVYR